MKTIIIEIKDGVALVTINRPESMNALNGQVLKDLGKTFDSLKGDNSVYTVILTGSGTKAFIAGADIKEMSQMDSDHAKVYAETGQMLTLSIENFPKPVIAAINGFALGGGCEFAMACHVRFASQNAKFGQPEVGLGLIAGFGGTQRLPRLVGRGKALELLLTGSMIDAREALSIGLVEKIFPPENLLEEAFKTAQKINKNSPAALAATIKSVNQGLDRSLKEGLKTEARAFSSMFSTLDKTEGINAFLERRKPDFSGK